MDLDSGILMPRDPPRSPHIALLSLLLPGLPQLIHRQFGKGAVLFAAYIASITWSSFLVLLIVLMVALVDAYKVGYALAGHERVGKWEWFP